MAVRAEQRVRRPTAAATSGKPESERALSPPPHPLGRILGLQQALGNQGVQERVSACPALSLCPTGGTCHACPFKGQAKAAVSQPGDRLEQEADSTAQEVLRMPEPGLRTKPMAQLRFAFEAGGSDTPPIVREVLRSSGQPLDSESRAFMESRFGFDFSRVRVHTDARAAESARAVNALAYTFGRDVVFGSGQYSPGNGNGRRILAHELSHVVQQAERGTSPSADVRAGAVDAHAARSAAAVGALAYTVSSDLVFGEGGYRPDTTSGRPLLAHELVHVAQQRAVGSGRDVLQRALVYSSGYPRRFGSDAEETRCVEAPAARCKWSPASIDFEATATRSGGGVGRASFATLLSYLETQAVGSINELGLIGHANADFFGLSGRITAHDVFFTEPGLIGVDSIAANAATIARLRDRFAPGAVITLYGCNAGVGDALLAALSRAFQVCVKGFSEEILTCIEWVTPSRQITSRGKVLVRGDLLKPRCEVFYEIVQSLTPDRESCVGAPAPAAPAAAALGAPPDLRWSLSGSVGAELEPELRALGTVGARLSLRSNAVAVFNPSIGLNLLYAPSAGVDSAHLLAAVADVGLRIQRPLRGAYLDLAGGGFVGFEAEPTGAAPTTGLGASLGFGWRWERVELGPELRALLPLTSGDAGRILLVGRAAVRF